MGAVLQVLMATLKSAASLPLTVTEPTVTGFEEKLVKVTVLLAESLIGNDPKSRVAEDAINGVILFCTAIFAFNIPAPQFFVSAQSHVARLVTKNGKGVSEDDADNMLFICAGVRAGLRAIINAAAATTCGVAMLVP